MNSEIFSNKIDNLLKRYRFEKTPISINFRDEVKAIKNTDRFTHFIHPYPAKLLQHIPYFFLNNDYFSKKNDTVLDPFCGSGSVLLEAMLSGRNAIGIDVNPLASLISKTKVSNVKIDILLKQLKNIIDNYTCDKKSSYDIPDIHNIDYWYSKKNIEQLSKLKFHILNIENKKVHDFFLTIFSICCKKFSYSDPRVSVPVKINIDKFPIGHKLHDVAVKNIDFIENTSILDFFVKQAKKNIEKLNEFQMAVKDNNNKIKIINCDIKEIDTQNLIGTVNLIITSPPYVSAQKYIRASSLSIQWLEFDKTINELNKESIGRETFPKSYYSTFHKYGEKEIDSILRLIFKKNPLRAYITYNFLIEMRATFKSLFSVLKNDGHFILVIGNNTIAGYEFYTHKYLIKIAERIGFTTKLVLVDDIKSRGLMTKRNKAANIITREYIIILTKGCNE